MVVKTLATGIVPAFIVTLLALVFLVKITDTGSISGAPEQTHKVTSVSNQSTHDSTTNSIDENQLRQAGFALGRLIGYTNRRSIGKTGQQQVQASEHLTHPQTISRTAIVSNLITA